jgi:hypothetical protein
VEFKTEENEDPFADLKKENMFKLQDVTEHEGVKDLRMNDFAKID